MGDEDEEIAEKKKERGGDKEDMRGKKRNCPENSEEPDDAEKRKQKKKKKRRKKNPHRQSSIPDADEKNIHKNRLQSFAQRCGMQIPTYQISNLEFTHAPAFRAIVTVDGQSFESSSTFSHVKEAEQDAARVALQTMELKAKQEECSFLNEDVMLCKSIFNEFAAKICAACPVYEVTRVNGPYHVSVVKFLGQSYTGKLARSKKEAEHAAAREAIKSILGTSLWATMFQVIKSKEKVFAATLKVGENMLSERKMLGGATIEESTGKESIVAVVPKIGDNMLSEDKNLCEAKIEENTS